MKTRLVLIGSYYNKQLPIKMLSFSKRFTNDMYLRLFKTHKLSISGLRRLLRTQIEIRAQLIVKNIRDKTLFLYETAGNRNCIRQQIVIS